MHLWRSFASGRSGIHLLIEAGARSVAGAYVSYASDGAATVLFTERVPVVPHEGEDPKATLERGLDELAGALLQNGTPALARAGAGTRIAAVRVALEVPWQTTEVRPEEVREDAPFTFTRRMLADMLDTALAAAPSDDESEVEQHVASMRLNGYQTRTPFGKKARRVSLMIVTSRLSRVAIETIFAAVRRHFHLSHARHSSGPALRYQVLRKMFPHERDMLIIDSVGGTGTISLVRAGALAAVKDFTAEAGNEAWEKAVGESLRALATVYPLPRTILHVSAESEAGPELDVLGQARLAALWLSDIPPTLIPVGKATIEGVALGQDAVPDTRLALLARYEQMELAAE